MKKILISDYDNTLFTSEESIKKNVQKIKEFREKGNLFVIATGRTYVGLKKVIEKYHLEYDYLLLSHGSVILDNHHNFIKITALDNNLIKNILNDVKKYPTVYRTFLFDIPGKAYDDVSDAVITKVLFRVKNNSERLTIYNELTKKYKDITVYLTVNRFINVEVISKKTNKMEGIKILAEKENITKENIFVIGDASNDLEMIKEFNGYGMVNSEACILDIATKLYKEVYELIEDII